MIIISVISLILALFYAVLVWFLKSGWKKIAPFVASNKSLSTKVSVIIAARNEEDKISLTIQDILNQNYPRSLFELIIVDDHSTDNTSKIIESYANLGVKLIKLNESEVLNSYKKKAIALAINDASGELIITTDADCRMHKDWLSTVVGYYESNDFKMISSPVVYFEEKSSFEKLQTLEFLYLIGLGAGGIGIKAPSTCNGANLCYKREVFFEVGGFKGIDDLASGDDELLLHKVAKAYPNSIGFCKSYDAVVYTHAKETLKEFIQQRRRWASKSVKYKDKRVTALAVLVWLFNVSLMVNLLFGLYYPYMLTLFYVQFLMKMLVEVFFLEQLTSFAKRKSLLMYAPVLSIVHSVYLVYIGIAGNSGKYNWKGRMVR